MDFNLVSGQQSFMQDQETGSDAMMRSPLDLPGRSAKEPMGSFAVADDDDIMRDFKNLAQKNGAGDSAACGCAGGCGCSGGDGCGCGGGSGKPADAQAAGDPTASFLQEITQQSMQSGKPGSIDMKALEQMLK